jgi:hypothetical protein
LLNTVTKPKPESNSLQNELPEVDTESDTPLGSNATPMLGGEQ